MFVARPGSLVCAHELTCISARLRRVLLSAVEALSCVLLQVSTATGGATEIAAGAVPPPEGMGPGGILPPPPAGLPEAGSSSGGAARVLALAGAGAVLQLYDAAAGRALARLQVGLAASLNPES